MAVRDAPKNAPNPNDRLNAHEKPPDNIRDVYKKFQKINAKDLQVHAQLFDAANANVASHPALERRSIQTLPDELQQIFDEFLLDAQSRSMQHCDSPLPNARVFESKAIPGLSVYPSLLPPAVQLALLDKLLHRDLSSPEHKTNLHMHYDVSYPRKRDSPASFFDPIASNITLKPKDASIHKPISIQQVLDRKLRWMTLGGQYDWTNKVYPSAEPPHFPQDIKALLESTFPTKAEAAIVNLYSPGDTLSLHRDVSEQSNQPLISISLGCDGIFVIGLDALDEYGEPRIAVLRLRSGDAVLMSGQSRFAWHGVPKIIEETCPEWMENWPAETTPGTFVSTEQRYEQWRGWMKRKRVNLNVRQMFGGEQSCNGITDG